MIVRNMEETPIIVTAIYESGKREKKRLETNDCLVINTNSADKVIEYTVTYDYEQISEYMMS